MPVVIIGAGPAGMAAASQLHRFGIKTTLFDQSRSGSLLKNAWCVENYLGVYPGKSGASLLQKFRTTLTKNKIKQVDAKVKLLDYIPKLRFFKIKTSKRIYFAKQVIVATGTKPKLLKEYSDVINPYLFYEVFPLLKKRRKTIVIIGGGDVAFDNALNLAKYNQIIICNRNKDSSALSMLIAKAIKRDNITYCPNYKLCSISRGKDNNLNIKFANQRRHVYFEADYLVVAIGRTSQKDFYTNKLKAYETQLLKSGKLFLIGDVKNDLYRQIAIATGDGIVAAMRIFHDFKR